MMFKHALTLLAVAAAALAQSITLTQPADLTTVSPGDNLTVQVTRFDTLTGSTEVALAIGLASCAGYTDGCASFDVTERLGTILYAGPYAPQYEPTGAYQDQEYQNFTVTVPTGFAAGEASLTVSHFSLVGAGPYPSLEVKNMTLIVSS